MAGIILIGSLLAVDVFMRKGLKVNNDALILAGWVVFLPFIIFVANLIDTSQ